MTASRRAYAIGVAVAIVVVAALVVVYGMRSRTLEPAAQTVQDVLELRADNVTDTAAYARYIESTSVASALAEDAAGRQPGESPIPEWETPRISRETSSTTDVLVKWRPSERFKDWPESTVFAVALRNGQWLIVDAEESQPESSEATTAPAESEQATGSGKP